MPLQDGLMVRIRMPLGRLSSEQALGLADAVDRYGAGMIELTRRANLQIRGLSAGEYAALVPELDALGLTAIDRTPSGRVNVTLSPFRLPDDGQEAVARDLSEALATAEWAALPQKFGFVVDAGAGRALAEVPGDIRIEAGADGWIVRPDGATRGKRVRDGAEAVALALDFARWFLRSGGVKPDGRGRMADLLECLPPPKALKGNATPGKVQPVAVDGPAWVCAGPKGLIPGVLRQAVTPNVSELRMTPFRAFFLPEVAGPVEGWNKAGAVTQAWQR